MFALAVMDLAACNKAAWVKQKSPDPVRGMLTFCKLAPLSCWHLQQSGQMAVVAEWGGRGWPPFTGLCTEEAPSHPWAIYMLIFLQNLAIIFKNENRFWNSSTYLRLLSLHSKIWTEERRANHHTQRCSLLPISPYGPLLTWVCEDRELNYNKVHTVMWEVFSGGLSSDLYRVGLLLAEGGTKKVKRIKILLWL